MDDKEIEGHVEKYKSVKPDYDKLTMKTEILLKDLLHEAKIKFHAIETRTKDVDSFRDKLYRKESDYKDPFKEMTDFSGIRLITYYQDDVERIIKVIKKEFEVDEENSIDKSKLMNPNEFGYLSVHYVVSPSQGRSGWTEWKNLKDHKCEIQIRTVLQHAWASISHALQYKQKEDVPTKLQRKLFRLAGLFELADEQFLEIRDNHEKEKANVNHIKNIETSDTEINLLTIQKYINESPVVDGLYKSCLNVGFSKYDSRLPSFSSVISLSKEMNILSITQLNTLLTSFQGKSSLVFKEILTKSGNDSLKISKSSAIFTLLLIFSDKDLTISEIINKYKWSEKHAKIILAIRNILPK